MSSGSVSARGGAPVKRRWRSGGQPVKLQDGARGADDSGMPRRLVPLLLVVTALLALATSAQGATFGQDIDVQCGYPGDRCDTGTPAIQAVLRAAPGEVNQVTVTRAGTDLVVHDATAPLTVAPPRAPEALPCTAVDGHTVSCPVGGQVAPDGEFTFTEFLAFLGDRDDSIAFATPIFAGAQRLTAYARIDAGAGDDVITGTTVRDFITPGRGHDAVDALGANDVVRAADGERDRIDCGAGGFNRATADRVDSVRRCQRLERVRR